VADERVVGFLTHFRELTRTAANEEEIRSRFDTAAQMQLGITDLKLERNRHDIRRNRVVIECKDKGLFGGSNTSAA
jgi:hypothetical protein